MCKWFEKIKKRENKPAAQPPTLAAFLPWGNSEGACCLLLAGGKSK